MNFSHKRVTVSTVGLIPEMEALSKEVPINLAVSLHAATNALRDTIAPINRKYPLEELIAAVRRYPMPRKKVVMFEYVVLGGVNDRPEDVDALTELLRDLPCKINLIPFNEWPGSVYKRPDPENMIRFRDALIARGFFAFVRQTRGRKILAACGQLATGSKKPKRLAQV
jgi:23S rRNA (adenine2503-C2)-methyltransferase